MDERRLERDLRIPGEDGDVAVVRQLSNQDFDSRADAITDLLWDHWMGEPDEPTAEQVRQFVVTVGRELAEGTNE